MLATDTPAEYLHCRIDELASNLFVNAEVQVIALAGGWLLVIVKSTGQRGRAGSLRFREFTDELAHIFSSFYELGGQSSDGRCRTWRVRHFRDCPWM